MVDAAAALLLPGQQELDADTLSLAAGEAPGTAAMVGSGTDERGGLLDQALTELERRLISEAMQAAGGNQSEAARRLGISRVGLIKKLGRLGLR